MRGAERHRRTADRHRRLSLGAGTVTGAIRGASARLARGVCDRVIPRCCGRSRLSVDETTLRLPAWRQLELLQVAIDERWKQGALPRALRCAGHHPEWSSLNPEYTVTAARDVAVQSLGDVLAKNS